MTSLPETMRGVVLTGHGDFDKLEFRDDLPVPRPGRGEVLIEIAAAAVNNTDVNTRLAWYSKKQGAAEDATWSGAPLGFPRVQGIDACGRIVAVGAGVESARIGERVLVEPCLREAKGERLEQLVEGDALPKSRSGWLPALLLVVFARISERGEHQRVVDGS